MFSTIVSNIALRTSGPTDIVSGVEDAFHAEAEGEVVEVNVVAHQPHLDTLLGDEAEVTDELLFRFGRGAVLHNELCDVIQTVTHAADNTERIIVFVVCQVIRVRVAPKLAWLYFFCHDCLF